MAMAGTDLGARRPFRILMYGIWGSGKSSWLQHSQACHEYYEYLNQNTHQARNPQRIIMHKDTGPEDLLASMQLVPSDSGTFPVTETRLGPAALAMQQGSPLIVDEVNYLSETAEGIFHGLLDDWDQCQVTLPDGSVVKPKPGFLVVATANYDPKEYLRPALVDRFDLITCWAEVHPDALATLRPEHSKALQQMGRLFEDGWNRGETLQSVASHRAFRNLEVLTDVFAATVCKSTDLEQARKDATELAAFSVFGEKMAKEVLSIIASQMA